MKPIDNLDRRGWTRVNTIACMLLWRFRIANMLRSAAIRLGYVAAVLAHRKWRVGRSPCFPWAGMAHALKRPGTDVIFWDTPVLEIDWGGPGTHAHVINASYLLHRWEYDGRHRDFTILTVGQRIELGIPRPEWLREPNLGRKAVDSIFNVLDYVARPDAVVWVGG